MRKLFYLLALVLLSQVSFGQAVNDQAVIPVSVTLNSILRLTVVSGGNIEFVVNTIDQYTTGINSTGANARYQTNFTVSSSQNFDVLLRAEDAALMGQDSALAQMPLDNIGYDVIKNPISPAAAGTWTLAGITGLAVAQTTIVDGSTAPALPSAGDAKQNDFIIRWRLGTQEGTMRGASLLSQSLGSDRYVTNVFLELNPK